MKKRFIAGARCPKCNGLDKVVMLTTSTNEWIECVECHYTENRPENIVEQVLEFQDDVGVIQFRPK